MKKKNLMKKILSSLITTAMLFSLSAFPTSAEGEITDAASLQAAIEATTDGTVNLTQPLTLDTTITIDKTITIDGGTNTITAGTDTLFDVDGNGIKLTLKNITLNGKNGETQYGPLVSLNNGGLFNMAAGTTLKNASVAVEITKGTFNQNTGTIKDNGTAVNFANSETGAAKFGIYGGTITGNTNVIGYSDDAIKGNTTVALNNKFTINATNPLKVDPTSKLLAVNTLVEEAIIYIDITEYSNDDVAVTGVTDTNKVCFIDSDLTDAKSLKFNTDKLVVEETVADTTIDSLVELQTAIDKADNNATITIGGSFTVSDSDASKKCQFQNQSQLMVLVLQ